MVVAVVAPEIQGRRHPSLDEAHLTAAAPSEARAAAARVLAPVPVRVQGEAVVEPVVPARETAMVVPEPARGRRGAPRSLTALVPARVVPEPAVAVAPPEPEAGLEEAAAPT